MHDDTGTVFLTEALVLLCAALIAVPLFKRLGLGIVLGYLVAGIAIGPWGLRIFTQPDDILPVAEFGVVLLLFIIGLELTPSRLWKMRLDVFGLGLTQVVLCAGILSWLGYIAGLAWPAAIICGAALALSSTAFAIQLLQERGQLRSTYGQKTFAILLFQDLCIVPLLALVALLAPAGSEHGTPHSFVEQGAKMLAAIATVVLVGRFLLNPLFRLLAHIDAREIMIVAALLIVVGAASLMQLAGLSMALGAFLAGVMLAESSYRHQLEADIEPFRVLLLGLFFMGVGMSIDLGLVFRNWQLALSILLTVMLFKGVAIWAIARAFRVSNADSLRIALTIPQGGEFAFVVGGAALAAGILSPILANLLSATVILSMTATPFICGLYDRAANRLSARGVKPTIVETFEDANAKVIIVGFGRFGQIAAQMLMADGIDIVAIERDPGRIELARKFGYKVYYGDATRPELLQAAGAANATLIALCFDNRAAMAKAIDVIRAAFPQAAIFCRAGDRAHVLELRNKGVDFEIRETFESGIAFGRAALEHLELSAERIAAIESDLRERDDDRLQQQQAGGMFAGLEMLHKRTPPGGRSAEKNSDET